MDQTFFVVETDPVISMDLVGLLDTSFPGTSINVLPTVDDAVVVAGSVSGSVCILIAGMHYNNRQAVPLATIANNGGKVIFIGRAHDIGAPARFVDYPFTSDMVLDAISNDAFGSPPPQPVSHT